jgi:hypothetical protein
LPDEFKRGFTIFYVKNINQVYKICFESGDAIDKKDFKELKQMEIEVEQYEDDNSSKLIIEQESILPRNSIEELLH